MTSFSAYEDEMRRFSRLSDEQLSRLIAGEAGVRDEAFDEVAELLSEVRRNYSAATPDEATRARHIAAISEASQLAADKGNPVARPVSKVHGPVSVQVSGLPKWRRIMDKTIGLALKAVAGTVAASMSMIGLAYAGVDLPGQAAAQALESVTGLELPNQDSEQESSVADDVRDVVDGDAEGCELGQAVADAADANRQDDATTDTDPCEQGEAQGSKATGEEKSAEGREKASEKSKGRSESDGSDASTDGRETAAEKSGTKSDSGADNAGTNDDTGRETGEQASSDGRSIGSSKSESGSDNAADNADDDGRTTGDDAASSGQENGAEAAEEGQSRKPADEDDE